MQKIKNKFPIQERLLVITLLSLNSGFIDGNTFLYNNERFAGMQTGNIIQAGIRLAQGKIDQMWSFLLPFMAFLLGIMAAIMLKDIFKNQTRLLIEEISLTIQLIGIFAVAIFGSYFNDTLVIMLLSFLMAMQANTFVKLRGGNVATVFTTGNSKTFATHLLKAIRTKSVDAWKDAFSYFLVIFGFFSGAAISTIASNSFNRYALLISPLILLVAVILISIFKD